MEKENGESAGTANVSSLDHGDATLFADVLSAAVGLWQWPGYDGCMCEDVEGAGLSAPPKSTRAAAARELGELRAREVVLAQVCPFKVYEVRHSDSGREFDPGEGGSGSWRPGHQRQTCVEQQRRQAHVRLRDRKSVV